MRPPAELAIERRQQVDDELDALASIATACVGRDVDAEEVAAWITPHREVWIARGPSGPVGYALLSVIHDEAELQDIGVAPDARGRGVGRALLLRVLVRAEERGASRVLLEVARGNAAALALYTSVGFTLDGVRPRYYRSGEDALLMSRPAEDRA
ncbi:MAG: GNAT family N-acetyltransferase [Sandaracinaceae bacterium]